MPQKKKKISEKSVDKKATKKSKKEIFSVSTVVGVIVLIIILIIISALIVYPIFVSENNNEEEEVKTEEKVTEEIVEEVSYRDTLSKEDIEKDVEMEMIAISLNAYYAEYERFPDDLGGLVPDFMEEVPKVPGTEEDFNYTVGENNQSFELSVALSEGGEALMKNDGGDDDSLYEVIGPRLELEQ